MTYTSTCRVVKGDLADKMPTNEAVGRAFTPSGNDSDDPVVVSSSPDTAQVGIVAEADAGTGTGADTTKTRDLDAGDCFPLIIRQVLALFVSVAFLTPTWEEVVFQGATYCEFRRHCRPHPPGLLSLL